MALQKKSSREMAEMKELENMVLRLRVPELQRFLQFAGKRKSGKKKELQTRLLRLLRVGSHPLELEIRKYYKEIQQARAQPMGQEPQSKVLPPEYPVQPNIKLKKLPFFDILGEILRPSSLMAQASMETLFVFYLTLQQSIDIASSVDCRAGSHIDYTVQVQMRFCLHETSCEQEDCFPPGIAVKVNGKPCTLPNPIPKNEPCVIPKRPPSPVNITELIELSPLRGNQIKVTWLADNRPYRRYAIAVYLVRKLSSSELLTRLKTRGARHSDYTMDLIKEKLKEDVDSEIATTFLRVSLACPLGKMRMNTPCCFSNCCHLQCFDASFFLQMNECKATWSCPVCEKPTLYENLVIDGYFQDVLSSSKLLPDVNEIQLLQDGSWENFGLKKEKDKKKKAKFKINSHNKIDMDTVDLTKATPPRQNQRIRNALLLLTRES